MTVPYDAQSDTPDEDLLVAYATGDRRAAQVLTRRMVPRLYPYAVRLLQDPAEAEDVMQEAMLRLWKQAPGWRPGEAQVKTWLYRVVSNLCTDRLRRRRGVGLDQVAEPEDDTPGVEAGLQTQARALAVNAALADLPERQRQAVTLRHLEGLSNPEIGQIMNIGASAVESLTARGKRALTAMLGQRRAELGFEDD